MRLQGLSSSLIVEIINPLEGGLIQRITENYEQNGEIVISHKAADCVYRQLQGLPLGYPYTPEEMNGKAMDDSHRLCQFHRALETGGNTMHPTLPDGPNGVNHIFAW